MRSERPRCIRVSHGAGPWAREATALLQPEQAPAPLRAAARPTSAQEASAWRWVEVRTVHEKSS